MWPFKKKIKVEQKRYPYSTRYESSNSSAWDSLGIIEKFALIIMPVALTFIDCFILEALFGLGTIANIVISIISTIVLMILIWWFAEWMVKE